MPTLFLSRVPSAQMSELLGSLRDATGLSWVTLTQADHDEWIVSYWTGMPR